MTQATSTTSSVLDSFLVFGNKAFEMAGRMSKIGADTGKRLFDGQLEFGNALADLGAAQLKGLTKAGAPADLLQRQRTTLEGLTATAQAYFEQMRGAVQDAQQAYGQIGQEVVGDLSKKLKPAA